jgi:hypothetical protein
MFDTNISAICSMNPEQYVAYAHNSIAVPEVIAVSFIIYVITAIVGLIAVKASRKPVSFLAILGISFIASLPFITVILLLPNSFHSLFISIMQTLGFTVG